MPNGIMAGGIGQGLGEGMGAIAQMLMYNKQRAYQQQQKDEARQNELTDYGIKLNMKNNLDLQNQQATDLQKQQENASDAPIISNLIQGGQNQDVVDRTMPTPGNMLNEPQFNQQFQKYSPSDIANQVGQTHLTPDAKKSFLEYLLKPKETMKLSQFDYSDPKKITAFDQISNTFVPVPGYENKNPYYTPPAAQKLEKVEGYNSDGDKVVQFYTPSGSLHHTINTGLKGSSGGGDTIDDPEKYNSKLNTVTQKDLQRQKDLTEYNGETDEVKRQGLAGLVNTTANEIQNDAESYFDPLTKQEQNKWFQVAQGVAKSKGQSLEDWEKNNQGDARNMFNKFVKGEFTDGSLGKDKKASSRTRALSLYGIGHYGYIRNR
jgi:hypothetical protein